MKRSREAGLSESLQVALVMPVLVLAVLTAVTVGLVAHARTAAREAATSAAELSALGRSRAEAIASAHALAEQGGLREVTVQLNVTDGLVVASVQAQAPTFLDTLQVPVTARVSLRKEPG